MVALFKQNSVRIGTASFLAVSGITALLLFAGLSTKVVHCPSIQAITRPALTIALGLDINSAYNRGYAIAAKNAVATSLDNAIQPGQGMITMYVSLIRSDSFNPAATVMVVNVPAIALPQEPSQPVYDPDPYKAAKQKQDYKTAYACWQAATVQVHNRVQQVQQAVRVQTDKLRALELPPANPNEDDIDGFLVRATSWFQHSHGAHVLLIASGFHDQQEMNEYDGDVPQFRIPGAMVRVIWYDCGWKDVYSQYTPLWQSVFSDAGATDINFIDPAQSQTITNFF